MLRQKKEFLPGRSYPLGATVHPDGVNFSVFSKNCESVELLLFDDPDSPPSTSIVLDPEKNRTFYYWHVFVRGIGHGQIYAYRVSGPFDPEEGHRFDGEKLLLDPYGRSIAKGRNYDRKAATIKGDNTLQAMKSIVVDLDLYDWEGDEHIKLDPSMTTIYELHVGGFTKSPTSSLPDDVRGTYRGVIEKIPYLKSLGITAVELLPVQYFDEEDAPPGLKNYWGYSPISFFAPHGGYSTGGGLLAVDEFRDMVKELHRAGIEVILDVVFNHTAEGDHLGPTFCFRGFENRAYYIPDPENRSIYANFTGCGNTVNANQSIVRRMIMDCLRYWVSEMHIDAFRFDLASVLARDEWGTPLKSPPILWEIESDPVMAGTNIIAEAWDAAGLYQVGSFIGHKWAEWNGRFRDDVRRFFRGDNGFVRAFSRRISGSPDLYTNPLRDVSRSVNFIACHDGFTMADLVAYQVKHNEGNLQNNGDGSDENFSENFGIEGPTSDAAILRLRNTQVRNFFTALLLSQGTPMILMGDEAGRSQWGNNNAYCQDNDISWLDWSLMESNADLLRFVKGLIHFRRKTEALKRQFTWAINPEVTWSGVKFGIPDWNYESHTLACSIRCEEARQYVFYIFNAYIDALPFELPSLPPGFFWRRFVDTSLSPPEDLNESGIELRDMDAYLAASHSSVILISGRF